MKFRLISSCLFSSLGSLAISAQATPVFLTDVTNQYTTSNPSCSVASAGGMGNQYYTYVGYRVTCGNTVISVTLTYDRIMNSCSVSGGATFTGSCNSYSIYR